MKKNDAKKIASATACLLLICFVVTFAVSGTNAIFEDKIKDLEWGATQESMDELLPAESYEEFEAADGSSAYMALDSSGATVGYVFITEAPGYGSSISVMTAISEGQVAGVNILDCSDETPGLGQNVANKDFLDQFPGVTAAPNVTKGEASGDNEIQAITGATKSSDGVANCVASALQLYEAVSQ